MSVTCVEKHYTVRPLDLLRMHHEKIEAWILEQAGVPFDAKVEPGKLRVETTNAQGMNLPGWGLHPLKGRDLKGHLSVWVSGNWRMTFTFDGTDAVLVDYQDYH